MSYGDFENARPHFFLGSEHSACADKALQTDYSSYVGPKPRTGRPGLAIACGGGPGGYGAQHEPAYGRRSEYEPSESGYGLKIGRPGSEFESGYGRKPEFEQPPPLQFGSGCGRRPEYERVPPPEFGSGHGRRPEYEQHPPPEFGPGHGRRPEYGENGSEYGNSESEYGYERLAEYEGGGPEHGTGHGWRNEDEYGSAYVDRTKAGYGSGYANKQSYGSEECGGQRTEFEWKPSFGRSEEEEDEYRKASYGRKNDDSDDEKRKSYGYGGEKGYGFKKYEDTSTLSLLLVKCVEETSKVLAKVRKVEIGGWFKLCLVLVLVFTSGLRGVRSEDIGDPLIPGSTAMNALLANENLRGLTLSERRQMLGKETPTINYPDLPGRRSPPNNPARKQANRYNRGCNIGSRCRQGSQGKKN